MAVSRLMFVLCKRCREVAERCGAEENEHDYKGWLRVLRLEVQSLRPKDRKLHERVESSTARIAKPSIGIEIGDSLRRQPNAIRLSTKLMSRSRQGFVGEKFGQELTRNTRIMAGPGCFRHDHEHGAVIQNHQPADFPNSKRFAGPQANMRTDQN